MDLGHWKYNGDIPADSVGFVYLIENVSNGRLYVGKKILNFKTRKKPLKGKKRARLGTKVSDYQTYTGSSKELNEDITKIGKGSFSFNILSFHSSKWELAYSEGAEIFKRDALRSEKYYNKAIRLRLGANK